MKKIHGFAAFAAACLVLLASPVFAGTLQQTVEFDGVTAQQLFDAFTNPADQAAALGAIANPVLIGPNAGDKYAAFGGCPICNGGLKGAVIASTTHCADAGSACQLVLSWRSPDFTALNADSIVVFTFTNAKDDDGMTNGAQIRMVHANVPDAILSKTDLHWNTFYWNGWRPYMAAHKQP